MKVVINRCYGGFSVSAAGLLWLRQQGNVHALAEQVDPQHCTPGGYLFEIPRDDVQLVAMVEQLGDAASGEVARLRVVEVSNGVPWQIKEHDGQERVIEARFVWDE